MGFNLGFKGLMWGFSAIYL